MTGEDLKNIGIRRAVEATEEGWRTQAYNLFKEYAKISGNFLVEDAREFAKTKGLTDPPSKRAWGGIVQKAKRDGVVQQVGFAQVKNPLAHMSNVAVWASTGAI